MSEEPFTTTLKRATRKAHAASDALVNAKLLLALNSDQVWTEGLLIFYEIFKFLEMKMKEKHEEKIGSLYIPEVMNRTSAFEEDLAFYLGTHWKRDYKIRKSVQVYLEHLKNLSMGDSDLLMAYVYHLFMGLLSGGQILQKKRELHRKILGKNPTSGVAVTTFTGLSISDIKNQLKAKMNAIAEKLDENKRKSLIKESINVFKFNNSIIKTVQGTEKVAFKNVLYIVSVIALIFSVFYYFYSYN